MTTIQVTRASDVLPDEEVAALQPTIDEIDRLKAERNAIVAAHNYMTPDIYHLAADINGDSLALAYLGLETDADVIVLAGDIRAAVAAARATNGEDVRVIVEVESLEQLVEAMDTSADRALLDNMTTEMLREAVEMVNGSMETEASGGVTLETVRATAETGVDYISVGSITHSAPQLDIALEFVS